MMIVLTPEEVAERREWKFQEVQPGFIVDVGCTDGFPKFVLVKSKCEEAQTLEVIPLSRENVFSLLSGVVPFPQRIGKDALLNIYDNEVFDEAKWRARFTQTSKS